MTAAKRFEWERAIRVLEIRPPVRKLVALIVATYANADGTNAHPGEDRLAVECGITARAVRGHLAALRDLGLLVRTFEGSQAGRRKLADAYALQVPADVIERVRIANDHRNVASGDDGAITGTSVSDHRNVSADHRNVSVGITGTRVPPTDTCTKDVDQPSPPNDPASAPSTDRAPDVGEMSGIHVEPDHAHSWRPDAYEVECLDCGEGRLHSLHSLHASRKAAAS